MWRHPARLVAGILVAAVSVTLGAQAQLSRADADAMAVKVQNIYIRGEVPPVPPPPGAQAPPPLRTSFTQREVNAYFVHYGPEFLPEGLVDPRITIGDRNQVSGRAIVDLDRIRRSKPRGWLDPLAYITGSMEVTLAGRVFAANGVGVIQFVSASVGGVAVSQAVLQELVSYYTVTEDNPRGFRFGEPFDLPSNIRAVELRPGAATVVQ